MHDHDHSHTHDHHDHEGESYFIDQLCMVGLSGAFGVICLVLWYGQRNMLNLMLGQQFHLYVVASGYVLVGLALARGWILWGQSKDPAFVAGHDHHHHDHDHHHHDHDHAHAIKEAPAHLQAVQPASFPGQAATCGHEHKAGEACDHGHEHHAHSHDHGPGHHHHHHHHHDHDEADHDHGWAPWRYVVILVPIILFLLGLPNKPPTILANQVHNFSALPPDAETHVIRIGLGADPFSQLAYANMAANYVFPTSKGKYVNYKELEGFADSKDQRERWKGRFVEVIGQYSPWRGTDHMFNLSRMKISCCANDAIQLNVPMMSREPISGLKSGDWVRVTGKVDFHSDAKGSVKTVVLISKLSDVELCDPDPNPYVQ